MARRILLVDDEPLIIKGLKYSLEQEGYETESAADGEEALTRFFGGQFDLILLDVMLPKMDGFTVARRIRESGVNLPILMLTARSELEDKVSGLDSGADYYLTKPFANEELLACLRALTRKNSGGNLDNRMYFGDLTLELSNCLLSCGERSVRLSRKEFDIMSLLMSQGDQVVPKETLILKVWGYESDAEDNNVEVYISFLRKKLNHLKSTVSIKALRMVGYHLVSGAEA